MIEERYCLYLDQDKYESSSGGTPAFPCGAFRTNIAHTQTGDLPWHWHKRVEVSIISGGDGFVGINGKMYPIRCGDGLFVNSNVLHHFSPIKGLDCIVTTMVFDPLMIACAFSDDLTKKYIIPLTQCQNLSWILMDDSKLWHNDALNCLNNAIEVIEGELYGYELIIIMQLTRLWFLLLMNNQEFINYEPHQDTPEMRRVEAMRTFLEENLSEKIMLKQVAEVGCVSERECIRSFKTVVGSTPMRYLQRIRLEKAARLLTCSNISVKEICDNTGFSDLSYFSKLFKRYMRNTPSTYRRVKIEDNK
jgi:AraC-like DNA-binding protein